MTIKLFLHFFHVLNATVMTCSDMSVVNTSNIQNTEKAWLDTTHASIQEYIIYDDRYKACTEHIKTLILTTLCAFKTWLYEQSNNVFTTLSIILRIKLSQDFAFLKDKTLIDTLTNKIIIAYQHGYKRNKLTRNS